jgi:hypothetical protein
MLLEHLEEEFDLPAITVDIADGSGAKSKVIGQKLDPSSVIVIPNYYPAQYPWVLETGFGSGETDNLVGKDIGPLRQRAVIYDFVNGIAFKPGNEENTGVIPLSKEAEVVVAPIHSNNATFGKSEMTSGGYIRSLTISDHGEVWHIAIAVQQHMKLNSAFGLAEFSPGKQTQAKIDGGRIKAKQLIPEAELPLLSRTLTAKQVTQMKEDVLIKLPGVMGISIRKGTL